MKSTIRDDRELPLFAWTQPSRIALFPSVRRRGFAERQARAVAFNKDPIKQLEATLRLIREAHLRKGISEAEAEADIAALRERVINLIPVVKARGHGNRPRRR